MASGKVMRRPIEVAASATASGERHDADGQAQRGVAEVPPGRAASPGGEEGTEHAGHRTHGTAARPWSDPVSPEVGLPPPLPPPPWLVRARPGCPSEPPGRVVDPVARSARSSRAGTSHGEGVSEGVGSVRAVTDVEPAERVEQLRAMIRHHNDRYYDSTTRRRSPTPTTTRWSASSRRSRSSSPTSITPDSPTQVVGGAASATFAPVVHRVPMMSARQRLGRRRAAGVGRAPRPAPRRPRRRATGSVGFVCELKIDGLAMSLRYEERPPRAGRHPGRRPRRRGRHRQRAHHRR